MKKRLVVALGGNALIKKKKNSIKDQIKVIKTIVKEILPLHNKYDLVITHGNGPQVGNILIRVEEALGKAYSIPLEVCVAESEGEIGYLIQQAVLNQSPKAHVTTIITQVLVDKNDPSFKHPSKPIGPFYKSSKQFEAKHLSFIEDAGRGFRRVVPSPKPVKILEAKSLKSIIKHHGIVIAAGGGGIPVIEKNKEYVGIEAVIDKDSASSVLATAIKAHTLLILTSVKQAAVNFNKKNQKWIKNMTISEAEEFINQGQFAPGSMLPKIQASIQFLKRGGRRVIITSPGNIKKALKGLTGTYIIK